MGYFSLLNIYDNFLVTFVNRSLDYGTNCFCNTSLFPDDFPHITFSDMKFQNNRICCFFFRHRYFIRLINEGF